VKNVMLAVLALLFMGGRVIMPTTKKREEKA
jgi:hypothetical protein